MLMRSMICEVLIAALSMAETPVAISSYYNDPFAEESSVKSMDVTKFGQNQDGRATLRSKRVWIQDEDVIYREDKDTKSYRPFAWNPWPETWKNPRRDLRFLEEERFPLFKPLRGADAKIVLKDGLQVWIPQDLNLGAATAYEAANSVKDAADVWSGRDVEWGKEGGLLLINAHSFTDFNAFFSPTARQVFLGVAAYRLPGETDVKMMETATSWEMVAHECGHAVHLGLKPNVDLSDNKGYRTWSESFADQMAMWGSLRNPERVARLLAETRGDLNQSNSLTRMVEAFASLAGKGTGLRDAFHDKKVSDTSEEAHDRSEVFTGASYRVFLGIYDELKQKQPAAEAVSEAGRIMGVFLTRANDYTPEDQPTMEDVAKAYLKVDKEFFGGRYQSVLVNEFLRRELFNSNSVGEWLSHEEGLPDLWLPNYSTASMVAEFLESNQDQLGIGPDFGVKLRSATRLDWTHPEQTIVRFQLTEGRGAEATPLDNHGIVVFRANGDLAEYHPPLPGGPVKGEPVSQPFLRAQALTMLGKARQLRLGEHGAPLSVIRKSNGELSVEVRVIRGEGLNAHMQVFTPENPRGVRREILQSPVAPGDRQRMGEELLQ